SREHISDKNVNMAIVINITKVCTHGCKTGMIYPVFQFVFKCSILLIDVQVIPFKKIIGYIYIGVEIIIYITNGNSQAKTDQAAMYSCFPADVNKFAIIIPEKSVSSTFQKICDRPVLCRQVPLVGVVKCIDWDETVVNDKCVQVTIQIVVEKCSVCCIPPFIGQTILF